MRLAFFLALFSVGAALYVAVHRWIFRKLTTDPDAPRRIASSRVLQTITFGYENHTSFAYALRWTYAFCATLFFLGMTLLMFAGIAEQQNPLQLWPITLASLVAVAAGFMSGATHAIFRIAKRRRLLEKARDL